MGPNVTAGSASLLCAKLVQLPSDNSSMYGPTDPDSRGGGKAGAPVRGDRRNSINRKEPSVRHNAREQSREISQPSVAACAGVGNSSSHVRAEPSHGRDGGGKTQPTAKQVAEYAGKRALMRLEAEFDESRGGVDFDCDGKRGKKKGGILDRKKLARVPQVHKSDLLIGEYLGRGNFCDVFEVIWIPSNQRHSHNQAKYGCYDGGDHSCRRSSTGHYSSPSGSGESLSSKENSFYSVEDVASSNDLRPIFELAHRRSISQIRTLQATSLSKSKENRPINTHNVLRDPNVLAMKCLRPAVRAKPRKFVIGAEDLTHETAMLACLDHPNIIQLHGRAAGCFSTAFQSNSGSPSSDKKKQSASEGYFIVLDRLTTDLTGRMKEWKRECVAISLTAAATRNETTNESPGPASPSPDGISTSPSVLPVQESSVREHVAKRIKVAYCIANALSYLHSKNVVFRDLKPANVGFDGNDCVKMFDFGFAVSVPPQKKRGDGRSEKWEGYTPLTETCGTRRYMAPEVAKKLAYGREVDVYSFGIVLWEICALERPFDSIQSVDTFHKNVVLNGMRPPLMNDPTWTNSLKELMVQCWSNNPLDRPTMMEIKSRLCEVLRDTNLSAIDDRGQRRSHQGGIYSLVGKMRRRLSI